MFSLSSLPSLIEMKKMFQFLISIYFFLLCFSSKLCAHPAVPLDTPAKHSEVNEHELLSTIALRSLLEGA